MSGFSPNIEMRCLSSLSKVFADEDLFEQPFTKGSALLNEVYSFQVAYRVHAPTRKVKVNVKTDVKAEVTCRSSGLVPSELPAYIDHDEHVLRDTPGLYPDPLYEIDPASGIFAFRGQWRSLWVAVTPTQETQPGVYPINIEFTTESGESLGQGTFELEIISAKLPEQQLIHTSWFHTDCLATWYGVDVFSEDYWNIVDRYIQSAADHGINMLLTPIFTPPLDTKIGGERPTVQLVDVSKNGETYTFGFTKLDRWIDLCLSRGIRYFEISHLFTQWGAKHAPKIMAQDQENGRQVRIFGWETDASGEPYRNFLNQFLPELVQFLRGKQVADKCYFHISDEPSPHDLEHYREASQIISKHLAGFPVMDALSDYEFYEHGLVPNPIPATDHIEKFIENKVENLWTYYCCGQYKQVANRFFNMPSARNRVLGLQLYKFDIRGFLHWGFNFWYSQGSTTAIDPYKITDAMYAFPSGDAFLVYPGNEGPVDSIRYDVFREALQDLRALQLLETFIGKEETVKLLEEGLERPISFSEYPRDAAWLLNFRNKVNQKIKQFSETHF